MRNKTNLKTLLVMVVLLAVVVCTSSVFATGSYDGGDGSEGSPFQINTAAQMDEIGQHPEDWDKCFILTADINLSGYTGTEFNIIGNSTTQFTGSFDGNGHTISNFTYTTTGTDRIGLFGCVGTAGGEIKNLGMEDVNVDAGTGWYVGGLVGRNRGTVSNCYAAGSVTGNNKVGGLVGLNDGYGTVSNCYAAGNVTGIGSYVGGLLGSTYYGTVSNCYAAASVSAGGWDVGGLVGNNGHGTVSNCYATGTVSGAFQVGGLVGYNYDDGTVSNCYATGNVTGYSSGVGGLVGYNDATISNCYAAGGVSEYGYVGGLVGINEYADIFASFWDTQTTGQANGVGYNAGSGTVEVYGRTTDEMKQQVTFTAYSWDFVNIWGIDEGVGYPYLICTDPDGDGICDGVDNCPSIPNPDQTDTDGDGVGNACDGCPDDPEKIDPGVCGCGVPDTDTDGDGTPDCVDNCPGDYNPDQADTDGDGAGDACDDDDDDDGVPDINDNCPLIANPYQSNVDDDGDGDLCDICPADALDECDPSGSGAWEIDPDEGGTIETPDGLLVIEIEPSDLDEPVTISVTRMIPPDPDVDIMIGTNPGFGQAIAVYDFEPDGLVFNEPVTVTITADVTDLNQNQRNRLGLYLWDDGAKQFVLVEDADCSIVEDPPLTWTKSCTMEVAHFSTIAMIVSNLHVDANSLPSGDGLSWETAYKYLQDALAVAGNGDEICVAAGTYTPDADSLNPDGTGLRTATFQLINDVEIYGGFPSGGDPNWNDRDPNAYETILSGDLDGNDVPGLDPCDLSGHPSRADNSYRVVTGNGTEPNAILDGFTITAGNANGGGTNNSGGGIINIQSSPTISNCTFSGNSALDGGGVCNWDNSSPMVTNCMFSGNSATNNGGGMYNENSNPTVTNCTFSGNLSVNSGGGIINIQQSSPTISNCTFSGNTTNLDGGGVCNWDNSSPRVTNCMFSGNSATNSGGGMEVGLNSSPTITNCTFSGNSADANGGGMWNNNYGSPTVTNCILWGNTASVDGNEIALELFSTIDVNYCDIQGGQADIYDDLSGNTITWGDNIDADPCFVDANGPDGTIGTEDDNLRLIPDSPCIDSGDNNSVPEDGNDLDGDGNTVEPIPWDLDGRDRIADGDCNDTEIVDMGAYEFTYAYLGDFDGSCDVDFVDYAILANYWMTDEFLVDIAPTPAGDGIVDERDLNIFCDNWLFGK